jgi:hypothetical protein
MRLLNTKKNYKKICIVITQIGSIFYLLPIIKKFAKDNIKIFVDINCEKEIKKKKLEYTVIKKKNFTQILEYRIIICNLTLYDFYEKLILKKRTNYNYLIQFLDNWNFVENRLYYSHKKNFYADEYWALDNNTKNILKNELKKKNKKAEVLIFEHPGILELKKKYRPKYTKKSTKILILLQPLELVYLNNKLKKFKYSTKDIIKFIKDFQNNFSRVKFYFAFHPLMKVSYSKKKNFIKLNKIEDIFNYTHIIGLFSTVCSAAIEIGLPTAILTIKREEDYLKNIARKNKYLISNYTELEYFIKKKLNKDYKRQLLCNYDSAYMRIKNMLKIDNSINI